MIYPFDLPLGTRVALITKKIEFNGAVGYIEGGLRWMNGVDRQGQRIKGFRYTVYEPNSNKLLFARRSQLRRLAPDSTMNQVVSWDTCAWKPHQTAK